MLRHILVHGLIAGAIVAIPMNAGMLLMEDAPPMSALIGYLTMLIALSVVFVAIKQRRDGPGGGVIKFWPAFGLGVGITAVASLVYALAWEVALGVTGFDFAAHYAETVLEQKRAAGADATELARAAKEVADFQKLYANPLIRVPITFSEMFPVGVIVTLVSAGLLRNSRFLPTRRARPA